jgi:hypothetical protein
MTLFRTAVVLFALTVALGSGRASAQTPSRFGGKASLVLSAERLTGYVYTSNLVTSGGTNTTRSSTTVSLLSSPTGVLSSNFGFPRVAFDGFVTDILSIGGAVSYVSASLSSGGTSSDITGLLLAPRVGFALGFSSSVGLWARGGVSYLSLEAANTTTTLFALTLEAPFVFSVADHFALTLGPTLDLGLSGSRKTTVGPITQSVDVKGNDVGVQAGLMGNF